MKTLTLTSLWMALLFGSPTIHSAEQAVDISNLHFRTNCSHCSKGRQAIDAKLDAWRLSEVQYDSLPLSQVLESLSRDLKYRDLNRRGINFVISTNAEPSPPFPARDPGTGLLVEAEAIDLTQLTIHIMPALRDVTLRQTLDAIVRVADRPIKYSIEDYGIVFSSRALEPQPLHTRWFRIDPSTLLQRTGDPANTWVEPPSSNESDPARPDYVKLNLVGGLVEVRQDPETGRRYYAGQHVSMTRSFAEVHEIALADTSHPYLGAGNGIDHVTVVTRGDQIIPAARRLFAGVVDFTQPGKQLFYSDRLGLIMVRATLSELEIIEQLMQALHLSSPQSKNEAHSVESSQRGVSRKAIDGATAVTAAVVSAGKVSNQPSDVNPDPRTSSYAEWVARFFSADVSSVVTSPKADPDQDGFSNWEEYGFGTSPVRADSVPRAEFVRIRVGPDDYPAIQFRRRAKADDLSYRVLFSSDLVSWHEVPSSIVAVSAPNAEGMESVTIRALAPMSGAQQQFLRVDLPVPLN